MLLVEIVTSLRRGDVGLDIVAALSMTGALVLGEALAAVVVALMYAGGQYLESYAEQRATRDMTALLSQVPRIAMRYTNGGLAEVPLALVMPGDRLPVRRAKSSRWTAPSSMASPFSTNRPLRENQFRCSCNRVRRR